MKKMKKRFALLLSCVMMIVVFAGCGAKINTEMSISKAFAGQRKINVVIEKGDISENVTGGVEALKGVVDSKIPAEMTYTLTEEESTYTFAFVVAFKNLDEYKSKVAKLITAGGDTELVPEVSYECNDTYFKTGLYLKENFTSFNLLKWYFNALQEANIITHSTTSEWYEMGSNKITVDEMEYSSGSELSLEERELYCLDQITVETTLNIDGTFKRVFTFNAYDSTVKELEERGCKLESYLSKLTPKGDSFKDETENSYHKYVITVNAKDAKELVTKTNTILQTKNAFSVETKLNKDNNGTADITVKEKLDGSFYLDYDRSNRLVSKINTYQNSTLNTKADGSSFSNDVFTNRPNETDTMEYSFNWKIGFASVEVIPVINSEEDAELKIIFNSEETMKDELKKAAIDSIAKLCKDVDFEETDTGCEISFAGTLDDVLDDANDLMKDCVKKNEGNISSDNKYFEATFEELTSGSAFSSGYAGSLSYDISPLVGKAKVIFNDNAGALTDYYYQGSFSLDDEGNRYASSSDSIKYVVVKVSLFNIILTVIFVLFILAGAALIVIRKNDITELISEIKEKSAQKAALKAQQQPVAGYQNDAQGYSEFADYSNNAGQPQYQQQPQYQAQPQYQQQPQYQAQPQYQQQPQYQAQPQYQEPQPQTTSNEEQEEELL